MAIEYTEEQLNKFDKDTIIQLFLAQQSQLKDIDQKLQLVLEQLAVMKHHRFGKSSERLDTDNQIAFFETNGEIVFFNEAEAVASITDYKEEEPAKANHLKPYDYFEFILLPYIIEDSLNESSHFLDKRFEKMNL